MAEKTSVDDAPCATHCYVASDVVRIDWWYRSLGIKSRSTKWFEDFDEAEKFEALLKGDTRQMAFKTTFYKAT